MPCYQDVVTIYQKRIRKAELGDAGNYLLYLFIAVRSAVTLICSESVKLDVGDFQFFTYDVLSRFLYSLTASLNRVEAYFPPMSSCSA